MSEEKKLMSPKDAHKVVFAIRSRLSRDNEREALEVALDCLQLQFEEVLNGEGWISVDERLPENFQSVLCHTPVGYPVVQFYSLYSEQDDRWFKERFTHWKSLPTPPTT